jgi:Holliday junction resolvasome RuvABC endonuclease subunit
MNIVGIDPSLTATGIAGPLGETTVVYPKACTGDDRLGYLYAEVRENLYAADVAVVEDLPTHAHGAGKTGMAQGVIRLAVLRSTAQLLTVTPATVKKFATGKGNATKADMRMALYQRTGEDVRDDNQVDAWWLRAIGHQLVGEPIVDLPRMHLVALAKVQRPTWLGAT